MRPDVDRRIAARASLQHGIIDERELRRVGMTRSGLRWRVEHGRLHPIAGCPGVWSVGRTALAPVAETLAAVRACGPGAVAAGEHAEWLWDLRPPWLDDPAGPVAVIVPRSCGRAPEAARILRRDLVTAERSRRHGVPVATVTRLVFDACGARDLWAVERLLDRALIERRTSIRALEAQLARSTGRRGAAALRRLLEADRRYSGLTRSELEEAFLALLRRAGVGLPKVNRWEGRDLVDALFADVRVAVELDGTRWHRTKRRQEDDRAKEMRLRARGFLVLRYTARQIFDEPEAVVADLVRVLNDRFHAGNGARAQAA